MDYHPTPQTQALGFGLYDRPAASLRFMMPNMDPLVRQQGLQFQQSE